MMADDDEENQQQHQNQQHGDYYEAGDGDGDEREDDDDGEASSKSLASGCSDDDDISVVVSDENVDAVVAVAEIDVTDENDNKNNDDDENNDNGNDDIGMDVDDAGKDQSDLASSRRQNASSATATATATAEIPSSTRFAENPGRQQQHQQQRRRRHNHQVPNWMKLSWENDKPKTTKNRFSRSSPRLIVRVDHDHDNDDGGDNDDVKTPVLHKDTTKTIETKMVRRRFCLVGRSEIEIRHGRVEILGTVLEPSSSSSSSSSSTNTNSPTTSVTTSRNKTSICSPYWSSWITVEIDTTCLPCELILSSIDRRRCRSRHRGSGSSGGDCDSGDHNHYSRNEEDDGSVKNIDDVVPAGIAQQQQYDMEEDTNHSSTDGSNSTKRRKIQVDNDMVVDDGHKNPFSSDNTGAKNLTLCQIRSQQQQQKDDLEPSDPVDSAVSTNGCTFRIMYPTRPVVLPPSWRNNVREVIDDFMATNHNKHDSSSSSSILPSSFEDNGDGVDIARGNIDHVNITTSRKSICLITGAKGVGKSTLLRYMTNQLLSTSSSSSSSSSPSPLSQINSTEVAILDIDVGQPELAPPGMISLSIVRQPLLRPPYWNLAAGTATTNVRNMGCNDDDDDDNEAATIVDGDSEMAPTFETISSVFFGSTTSKTDPARYLQGISFLMAQYESIIFRRSSSSTNRLPPPPLLVNCDGWVKGLGNEILVSLIQDVVRPTHICQIVGQSRAQTFDLSSLVQKDTNGEDQYQNIETPSVQPTLHILEACTSMSDASLCTVPSYTLRNFRWATYFLPSLTGVFDTWDTMQAKELQTGWIVAKQSAFESHQIKDMHTQYRYYGPNNDTEDNPRAGDGGCENEYDDIGDECILAQTLASERPYAVPFESVDCQLVGSEFHNISRHDDQQQKYRNIQVMNGNIVGLCTDASSMECIGLGIVRSVDWSKQILYIIVPDSVSSRFALPDIRVLVGGHLTLPMPLIFRGVYAESFLFHAVVKNKETETSNTSILGLEPMRSRNNISRRSLTVGKP